MQIMTKQQGTVNIYDIKYPCYVSPIPPNSTRILHIPGELEYKHLNQTMEWAIEAYHDKEVLHVFDAMPRKLWYKGVCQIPFEKRLKYVRILVTDQIAAFDKVLDLSTVLIDNPIELRDYSENLKELGYETIRIMDTDGFYVFGECQNNEYMEMSL